MKKAGSLLGTILDLGEQLLISGAEVWRVDEVLASPVGVDPVLFKAQGSRMLLIAAGIALGYIAADVLERLAIAVYTKYTARI